MPKPSDHENRIGEVAPHESGVAESSANEGKLLKAFLGQRTKVENRLNLWVSCRSTAADLCQELFIRLWRKRNVEVQDLGQYMIRSARNLAIDHLRSENIRSRPEHHLVADQLESSPTMLEDGHQVDRELQQIEDVLIRLPERTRHIFLLNRLYGQSYTEIAEAMNLSVSAVEKHMMRALQACKRRVQKAEPQ